MVWYVYMIISVWGFVCFFGCVRLCLMSELGYCCKCQQRFRVNDIFLIKQNFVDYPDSECPICLGDFTKKNQPHALNFCNNTKHPFHKDCILQNFQKGNIDCPVCRATLPLPELEV
jgi:hypothetical protein